MLFKSIFRKSSKERNILLTLLALAFVSCFFIMDLFFDDYIQYSVMFIVLLVVSNCIEISMSILLSKIIPSDWKFIGFSNGFIISVVNSLGKTVGSVLISVSLIISNKMLIITYSICAGLFLIAIVLCFVFYSDLRVKAIARIMNNRTIMKRNEH